MVPLYYIVAKTCLQACIPICPLFDLDIMFFTLPQVLWASCSPPVASSFQASSSPSTSPGLATWPPGTQSSVLSPSQAWSPTPSQDAQSMTPKEPYSLMESKCVSQFQYCIVLLPLECPTVYFNTYILLYCKRPQLNIDVMLQTADHSPLQC